MFWAKIVQDKVHPAMYWVECSDGWRSPDYVNKTRASYLKFKMEEHRGNYDGKPQYAIQNPKDPQGKAGLPQVSGRGGNAR